MLILIILAVIAVSGYLLMKYGYDGFGMIAMSIGAGGLFLALSILAINHLGATGQVAHYHEVVNTVDNMKRSEVSESEIIILSQKIIEVNTFIAEAKAYNKGLLDIFISDKLVELEPIRYNIK